MRTKGVKNERNSFIGLDLAWNTTKHSGIAVMQGDESRVSLEAVSAGIESMDAIIEYIAEHSSPDTVLAIDASLIVNNQTGQRPCETLVSKAFGAYHASCHTSNLSRPYATTGMELVSALEGHGFVHDFNIDDAMGRRGKWLFEVYPHPAMVRLFDLAEIIRYKKGPVAKKREGLNTLVKHLKALAGGAQGLQASPALRNLLERDTESLCGSGLKEFEDTLDAVFCAYLAWHCWRYGMDGNDMYGTMADGYIVVPKARVVRPLA